LTTITPKDEVHVMKLSNLYITNGQKDKLIALLDRFLKVVPDHEPAMLEKASGLFDKELYDQAEQVYKRVHELNPYDTEAVRGMADCELSMGHVSPSIQYTHQLVQLDPTNPRFILMEARVFDWAGQPEKAKAILLRWVRRNQGYQPLPILLYHGLTTFKDDPLLANLYHYTVETFDDQMRAVSAAGYTPVTTKQVSDWVHKRKPLPKRPILITFDDGRLDSFEKGDPILQKYHLKATMCAALVNMEGMRPPGFVPWQKLAAYQRTGRWEIVSHGDIAHIYIPISADGAQSLFLTSKKWLDDQNRLETDQEWEERLRSDYESSRDKIAKNIGDVPVAYAFPEGIYGQQGHCNTPHTEPINRKLVRQYFDIAFAQDPAGINYPTRDPWILNRHEPDPRWTGADLLRFLHDQDPLNQIYKELSDISNWQARPREALSWYTLMEKNGVSQPILLAQEAKIRFAVGDAAEGQALAQRAMMNENLPDVEKSITSALATTGPEWVPTYTFEEDNQGRRDWTFEQSLTSAQWWKTRWSVIQRHSEYFDSQAPKVMDNGIGGAVDLQLGLFNTLHGEGMQHYLSGHGQSTETGFGRLDSRMTDNLEATLSGGRSIYYTARALDDHVNDDFIDLIGKYQPEGPWRASARGKYLDLTDTNRRRSAQLELSRALFFPENFRLVYQFTYDEMKFVSPDYYSPQELRMHAFGPEITFKTSRSTRCTLRYLPAYAAERGGKPEVDHNAEADLQFRLGEKTYFKPSFSYSRTPTYREDISSVMIEHYF